jgi:2-oxoglutarate ferredoxin oxidoreductase subunit alpha
MSVIAFHDHQREKYEKIKDKEVRYETYHADDADLLLVSYGSSARICRGAVDRGRAEGLKLGLFRPITVWPFPNKQLREAALKAGKVLVVEDSIGEFIDDVEFALMEKVPVHLLGVWGRHLAGGSGIIHPERVLEEVKKIR